MELLKLAGIRAGSEEDVEVGVGLDGPMADAPQSSALSGERGQSSGQPTELAPESDVSASFGIYER